MFVQHICKYNTFVSCAFKRQWNTKRCDTYLPLQSLHILSFVDGLPIKDNGFSKKQHRIVDVYAKTSADTVLSRKGAALMRFIADKKAQEIMQIAHLMKYASQLAASVSSL